MAKSGRLLVCATPIGNLGDVTLRVLDALRNADMIVAEDTRVTSRLLAKYSIETPLERYDAHTAARRTGALVERMAAGETIALVSDAGTPGISDPGELLVRAAIAAGVKVDVLPGPSAIITALVASGLPAREFYFGGFLPRKAGERRRILESLTTLNATLVFYESPNRVAATLAAIAEIMPGRTAAVARELTKLHEEVVRGEIVALASMMSQRALKGEVVIVVGPPAPTRLLPIDFALIRERVDALVADGKSRSDAIKQVAHEMGLPRNIVYRSVHDHKR